VKGRWLWLRPGLSEASPRRSRVGGTDACCGCEGRVRVTTRCRVVTRPAFAALFDDLGPSAEESLPGRSHVRVGKFAHVATLLIGHGAGEMTIGDEGATR
jgi:hypothetical protein